MVLVSKKNDANRYADEMCDANEAANCCVLDGTKNVVFVKKQEK
ncbi:MAG: hypothetical protein ABL929_01610 [Ferruginibacter sp.]